MTERSFLEQILLDEIQGKNAAVHAYDRVIWTIRTGYVTIFFAAWGILLTGLASADADLKLITALVVPLWIISVGLSICAWVVDLNYMRRKFRVINALNLAFNSLVDFAVESELPVEDAKAFLRISGYAGDRSFVGMGYREAKRAGAAIYVVPCLTVAASLLVFGLIISERATG